MAEPERATSTNAQSAPAASDESHVPAHDSAIAHKPTPSNWKAPFLATLGAAFGTLIGAGLHEEF